MTDIQKAMLGDKEAAERLTERGEMVLCPLCNGKPRHYAYTYNEFGAYGTKESERKWNSIGCPKCKISQPKRTYFTLKDALIEWNTRPQLLTKEQIEALERMEEE